MNAVKQCPECGKQMQEEANFPGLWICPDGKVTLNDKPPFRFKCPGMELTEAGAAAFEEELMRVVAKRN